MCLAYNDCCWDFHDFCPDQVSMYNQTTFRHAKPVCVEGKTFLTHNGPDESADDTSLREEKHTNTLISGFVYSKSLADLAESFSEGNALVTDIVSGVQYRSARDFALFHPSMKENLQERLASWRAQLIFPRFFETKYYIALVQNKSLPINTNAYLVYVPNGDRIKRVRQCPMQARLVCRQENGQTRMTIVTNFRRACNVISNSSKLLDWRMSAHSAVRITEPVQTAVVTMTTSYGDDKGEKIFSSNGSFTSTPTPNIPELCSYAFMSAPSHVKTQFSFPVMLNVNARGILSLTAATEYSIWTAINCSDPLPPVYDGVENSNPTGCQPQISCTSSDMFYFEGNCIQPAMITLKMTVQPGTNDTNFPPEVKYLIDTSGLLNTSELVFSQDPDSCYSKKSNSTLTTYYGIYYMKEYPRTPPTNSLQSLASKMAHALTLKESNKLMQPAVELCLFLVGIISERAKSKMLKRGKDPALFKSDDNFEVTKTSLEPKVCQEPPWAWQDNIFTDRLMLCRNVDALTVQAKRNLSELKSNNSHRNLSELKSNDSHRNLSELKSNNSDRGGCVLFSLWRLLLLIVASILLPTAEFT
ncbi:hypothetical protein PoB_006046700 [Plakobranchus ocellatus]|uniref:SMB domain-containing protein n=1 Tax=Plakobranchus ocellatus TaxID=259542 RepID=A0AAV4CPZ5_9GAST|nr:hypothetical protein PoB_006046700 [Plakobranchus ocellatus]